tara:strand:- start:4827 stop:6128 length:1302 start_codon:yes stop_codon:yes gene_type:complete
VSKILKFLLLLILITNCSLDKKTGFWSKPEEIKNNKNLIVEKLFENEKSYNEEFNSNLKIKLSKNFNVTRLSELSNNNGRIDYESELKKISKFKYSKIDNFNKFEPDIIIDEKSIIFFDKKGTLLKFDKNSKLIWKKNYYSKGEKKIGPLINLASYNNYLIITDNLAKYYAVDINTGNLLWMKQNKAPFNSQVKIHKNKIYTVDYNNVLRCFSIKDGIELWNVKTESSFIKSSKKLSLVIGEKKIIFENSIGDISAVDINTAKLIWQTPTQDNLIYENSFNLKSSDMVLSNKSILFSNNFNEFYSMNIDTGILNWKQSINSSVRPSVVENFIFTVTNEGFLVIIDENNGNIIRISNVYNNIKKKKRSQIFPVGFAIGKKNIYLTLSNGRLIIIDIETGKSKLKLKIDNEKISRPIILDKNLFIIKNNSIIKFD